jgi:hypothetical protein
LDAEDGTIVVVDATTFAPRTRGFITAASALGHEWVLPRWFTVPSTWQRPPILVCDAEGYNVTTRVTPDGVVVQCPGWWGWLWSAKSPVLRDGNFILVRYAHGHYRRVFDEVTIAGRRLKPKPLGAPTPGLELSTTYRRLFEQAPSASWDRLGGRCWHPEVC